MAHSSHTPKDDKALELGYQPDDVNIGALTKFLIGLAFFMGISFVLMYGLYRFMEYQAAESDRLAASPTALTEKERSEGKNLPPEPRLQAAPGFGVTLNTGQRVSLEKMAPQSEYRVIHQEWNTILAEGMKDAKTGTMIAMPIEKAKEAFLTSQPAVRSLENITDPAGADWPEETNSGRMAGAATMTQGAEGAPEGVAPKANGAEAIKPATGAPKPTPATVATPKPKAAAATAGKR